MYIFFSASKDLVRQVDRRLPGGVLFHGLCFTNRYAILNNYCLVFMVFALIIGKQYSTIIVFVFMVFASLIGKQYCLGNSQSGMVYP